MRYAAEIHIDAPAERVWAILTDGSAWPEWEPNVTKLEGTITSGGKITVHTKLSDQAFPVSVDLQPHSRMTWSGGMPLGLFKGVRTFEVSERGESTHVAVHEQFSGLMLPIMRRMMPDLQPSFDAFVTALKARAET